MRTMPSRRECLKGLSLVGLFLLSPLAVGCGAGQGKVTGQVLIGSDPLPGGRVTFVPVGKGNSVSVDLDDHGNYEAVLPAGEVQVAVDNSALAPHEQTPRGVPPGLPPKARAALEKAIKESPRVHSGTAPTETIAQQNRAAGKYIQIPKKYYDVSTSGLKFTVTRGDQKHNIELTK